jgi:hypothetical protein
MQAPDEFDGERFWQICEVGGIADDLRRKLEEAEKDVEENGFEADEEDDEEDGDEDEEDDSEDGDEEDDEDEEDDGDEEDDEDEDDEEVPADVALFALAYEARPFDPKRFWSTLERVGYADEVREQARIAIESEGGTVVDDGTGSG